VLIRRPWVLTPDDESFGRINTVKIHECLAAPLANDNLLVIEAATEIEAGYWFYIVYETSQPASVLPNQPVIRTVGADTCHKIWSEKTKATTELFQAFVVKRRVTRLGRPDE
jgi:hypothetical protein